MLKDFFHLAYLSDDRWLRPLMSRLRESSSKTLRQRMNEWGDGPLSEMGLALATKLELLRIAVARFDADLDELSKEIEKRPDEVKRCIVEKAALVLPKKALTFQIVADIDSFLFEARSAYEIVGRFLREFFSQILQQEIDESALKTVLAAEGCDTHWIDVLRGERIRFFHQTTPWIALEVAGGAPKYGLLILRRNTHDLSDPNDYARFDEYRTILRAFADSMQVLHQWVVRQIEDYEQREARRLQ